MAYRPRAGHTDAQRKVISNIHARGVPPESAALRIVALAERMRATQRSGVEVNEEPAGFVPIRESQSTPAAPQQPGADEPGC
jgi:ethanolamine ammonia-lyase small subunit